MPLSWNEIRDRAMRFSKEWENESSEDAEAKSFWDGFFAVFGIDRRRLAQFEKAVARKGRGAGFIDLFWPGTLIVEHKSRGRNLTKAFGQAIDYFEGLKDHELPQYVLVSDFARFRLYNLEQRTEEEFALEDFHKHIKSFGFMLGYQQQTYKDQDPVNIEAALKMGGLHDKLKEIGYDGHDLEVYLVRLLFCLFADDTSIFERGIFLEFLTNHTREDGFDLGQQLALFFQILDTPPTRRPKNLDDTLAAFPYVNGQLFRERLPISTFDRQMRQILLDCSTLDWGRISPAIFGSLFQSVMNPAERRNLGAHYTSERNILKAVRPLFLTDLWLEFESVRKKPRELTAFHGKLANLRFLDPACGCGNFLIITYRELRLLEIEVIKAIQKGQQVVSVNELVLVNVDKFFGIEYEEFPAQIAQVAMWLMDHQMNLRVSEEFGQYYVRLPLDKSATIAHGNALRIDWQSLLPMPKDGEEPVRFSYIVGNPPFIGSKMMSERQRTDIQQVMPRVEGNGVLDYVSGWYWKAALYMQGRSTPNKITRTAFVSTNSVVQGEQVGILWGSLLRELGIQIQFAHQTFKWSNEARGNAAVFCIIVGYGTTDVSPKRLYHYDDVKGDPDELIVRNINPYLVEGSNVVVMRRSKPLCPVPEIGIGNKPIDGGHYLFTPEQRDEFVRKEPQAAKWFRRWLGADEFINGYERWCLWLGECPPAELRQMPEALKRVEAVRKTRLASSSAPTRKLAQTPTRFHVENRPTSNYLIIPEVSSERRRYIPIGYESPETLSSNLVKIVPNASLYHFGVLTSEMHMTWVRYVCGRLKSDYRYSKDIVYNNYPWPQQPTEKLAKAVEMAAQTVLDVRASFVGNTLADLYDPLTMPPALVKAHATLDRAVDACYRPQAFANDVKRMEFLFALYEQYTVPLLGAVGKKKKR